MSPYPSDPVSNSSASTGSATIVVAIPTMNTMNESASCLSTRSDQTKRNPASTPRYVSALSWSRSGSAKLARTLHVSTTEAR
jgi:hypothetical protein